MKDRELRFTVNGWVKANLEGDSINCPKCEEQMIVIPAGFVGIYAYCLNCLCYYVSERESLIKEEGMQSREELTLLPENSDALGK